MPERGSEHLRNVSNTCLNLWHQELRRFWRWKEVQPTDEVEGCFLFFFLLWHQQQMIRSDKRSDLGKRSSTEAESGWWGGGEAEGWLAGCSWGRQQPGWWITPALSWVNGHRHPSPPNNVSACIVIETSPKMEVNKQLSYLIWEAVFLIRARHWRNCKRSFQSKPAIIFLQMSANTNIHQRAQRRAGKRDNPALHRFSQD